MKISIITATFNSDKTISSCIASINNQTLHEIEHIIIDAASEDNTLGIIKSFASNKIKLFSGPDEGIYDALNKGIKMASGDIIGFVHSDDLLDSLDILQKISKLFEEEDVDGVYGDLLYVNKQDTAKVIRYWKSKEFNPSLLNKGWMPPHPTLFVRKEVYQKHGYFNLNYKIGADYDLILRVFSDNKLKFKYLPMVITKMRIGGLSNKGMKNILLKSYEDFIALRTNKIPNPLWVLFKKNLSKLPQFFRET